MPAAAVQSREQCARTQFSFLSAHRGTDRYRSGSNLDGVAEFGATPAPYA